MEPNAVTHFVRRHVTGTHRLIEAVLVISIVVAYLLVVTRGQIVSMLAGPAEFPAASAAHRPANDPASSGERTP